MPQDAFGNDISARTNVLDVAGHYPYSPERWRLFADGSRIFPEYEADINDLSQYAHNDDTHDLSPAGKDFKKGSSSDDSNEKRNLPRDDIAVVLGKSGTTGDALYATDWEEDW